MSGLPDDMRIIEINTEGSRSKLLEASSDAALPQRDSFSSNSPIDKAGHFDKHQNCASLCSYACPKSSLLSSRPRRAAFARSYGGRTDASDNSSHIYSSQTCDIRLTQRLQLPAYMRSDVALVQVLLLKPHSSGAIKRRGTYGSCTLQLSDNFDHYTAISISWATSLSGSTTRISFLLSIID